MALPAPYAPPWKRLGEDLVATLAWLGLKARELWRRNGEGSLPMPPWWPRRATRLFWPLALALALVGGAAVTTGLRKETPPSANPAPAAPREAGEPAQPNVQPGSGPAPEGPMATVDEEAGVGSGFGEEGNWKEERRGEGERDPERVGDGESTAAMEAGPQPVASEEVAGGDASEEIDPLLERWNAEDRRALVEAITAEPANATLTLRLNDHFTPLVERERQDWVERWRIRAEELGYSHLRLLGPDGRLVGREAQVGSGMILFQPGLREAPSR